jgi:hypothetical protein
VRLNAVGSSVSSGNTEVGSKRNETEPKRNETEPKLKRNETEPQRNKKQVLQPFLSFLSSCGAIVVRSDRKKEKKNRDLNSDLELIGVFKQSPVDSPASVNLAVSQGGSSKCHSRVTNVQLCVLAVILFVDINERFTRKLIQVNHIQNDLGKLNYRILGKLNYRGELNRLIQVEFLIQLCSTTRFDEIMKSA